MEREKSLLKNTIILTVGSICTKLITFFLLPIYTKVLNTEEYGIVDLLNTLVSLMLPIVTFQVEQAVFRKLIEKRGTEEGKDEIISTSFFSVLFQCAIYLIIFFSISPFIQSEYKFFLATNVIAYIIASFFQQICRGNGKNKLYSLSGVISASTTIIFNLIFILKLRMGAKGMLLGTLCGQIACIISLLVMDNIYKYINYKKIRKNTLKELYKYSIPLIPNSISWWVFNASDKVIVSYFLGLSMNGILAASHKFSGFYITMYNIFHLSWIESISVHIDDDDISDYFNKMFNTVLYFFASISISIIAVMPFVYPVMVNSNYSAGFYQVPITMIGSIFNVIIALDTAIYVGKKNTKAIANTAVVSAIINIVVHIGLIKFIGLYAATISTALAYAILAIYRHYDINKKYFKIRFDIKKTIASIIMLVAVLGIYYYGNTMLNIAGVLLVLVFDILINKDSITVITKVLKNKIRKRS